MLVLRVQWKLSVINLVLIVDLATKVQSDIGAVTKQSCKGIEACSMAEVTTGISRGSCIETYSCKELISNIIRRNSCVGISACEQK